MLPTLRTILCATDLGRSAPVVLRYAASLARAYGGTVAALHALEPLGASARHMVDLYAGEGTTDQIGEREWRRLEERLRARLQAFCDAEGCRDESGRELIGEVRVSRGRPADVILAEAGRIGADAIVIGSHGHTPVGELLLGSTAHRVTQKARVPVLLVRVEADGGAGA